MSADYDGDGVADLASWDPWSGTWVVIWSGDDFGNASRNGLGSAWAVPVPADYDGDGAAEIAVFEPRGYWTTLDGESRQFGRRGDIPVPSDYDGDGDDDLAVFRPSKGKWKIAGQSDTRFGKRGDVPVPADLA